MGAEETRAVIERYFGAHSDRSIFAEDVEFRMFPDPEPYVGVDALLRRFDEIYGQAFSPSGATADRIHVDGDTAIVEFTFEGTSTGTMAGGAPAGTEVTVPMCGVYEVQDGRIKRARIYSNGPSLLGKG
jgi:ketosteroid isomerase-like protein